MMPQTQGAAAILLCAGKGTRMCDDSRNKVCFDCAGVPVITRIIANMRAGGVSRFVVVVGHRAESVMSALDGVPGVVYAYQKEQKGTGHAAQCGLKVLADIGFKGPVVVSMGDKIVATHVVRDLLAQAGSAPAVLGVQPRTANPHGGHVMMTGKQVCGIVEFADAASMALAEVPAESWRPTLAQIGLSGVKAEKVCQQALLRKPHATISLAGHTFTASDVLNTPFVNTALYCFDSAALATALEACQSNNAQGEIYLTDTIATFATADKVAYYEVTAPDDLLTYSTRSELRAMSRHFLHTADDLCAAIQAGAWRAELTRLYGAEQVPAQEARYTQVLQAFKQRYGAGKVIVARAGGRVNLMGRHIEHRGGGINVFATSADTLIVAAPRTDDQVNIADVDPNYPAVGFSISGLLGLGPTTSWLDYLAATPVKEALAASRGHWSNYVKSAVLRFQMATDLPLCGMDILCSSDVPAAAGLSSSSSIVVAVAQAVVALNALNIPMREFVELCGEGEWFVGSRGGAGDHAAIACSQVGRITHLDFKPFGIGTSVAFSPKYAILVANSLEQARKAEGGRDRFNAQVTAYELAFMLIRQAFPDRALAVFRDLSLVRPFAQIYGMLRVLPETVTRAQIRKLLPESGRCLDELFATHADPGIYRLREVALYGISECARSAAFMALLKNGDYAGLGQMMKTSHDGDRLGAAPVTDEVLDTLAAANADVALQSGSYACSTARIDSLCDLLNGTAGVLGSQLVGAGLGGCVVALVEKDAAPAVVETLNQHYYAAHNLPCAAAVFTPGAGASVFFGTDC